MESALNPNSRTFLLLLAFNLTSLGGFSPILTPTPPWRAPIPPHSSSCKSPPPTQSSQELLRLCLVHRKSLGFEGQAPQLRHGSAVRKEVGMPQVSVPLEAKEGEKLSFHGHVPWPKLPSRPLIGIG